MLSAKDPQWTPECESHVRSLSQQVDYRILDGVGQWLLLETPDEENAAALAFFRQNGFGQEWRHVYLSQNLDDHPLTVERRHSERNGRAG